MLAFHAIGDWGPGQVRLAWADRSSRRIIPEVEHIIEQTWARVSSRSGVHLFDGPMCRMESFIASDDALKVSLSATTYKPFLGTNLHNPQLAEIYGREVMANPVGVSALLETADGGLLLGRRNAAVAYYPDRVHPFAGALEPRDGTDAFGAVYRELEEELSLPREHISDVRCSGLVEDLALLQPELIFSAKTDVDRDEIAARMDRAEHDAMWSITASMEALDMASKDPDLTPVAVAALVLWGRLRIGAEWFERARRRIQP